MFAICLYNVLNPTVCAPVDVSCLLSGEHAVLALCVVMVRLSGWLSD